MGISDHLTCLLRNLYAGQEETSFPGGSEGKESACNAGDWGLIPGLGKSSGERYGNPLQYSCLENSMDRGAWQDTVHGVAKSWTQLSDSHTHTHTHTHTRKQQLESDMEQQTGSKSGKEYVKAVYCHPAYLTYMQNTA